MALLRFLYYRLPDILMTACLAAILALAWVQVYRRYILESPAVWTEEAARLLLVWAAFLAAGVACRDRDLMSVNMLPDALPQVIRRYYDIAMQFVIACVGVFLVIYGTEITQFAWRDRSTSLGVPRGLFYLPAAVGGGLMILYSAGNIISNLRRGSAP